MTRGRHRASTPWTASILLPQSSFTKRLPRTKCPDRVRSGRGNDRPARAIVDDALWFAPLSWRRQSGQWRLLSLQPSWLRPNEQRRGGARRHAAFASKAPRAMPCCVVRASGPVTRRAKRAAVVWAFACPGLPHTRIRRFCGWSPWPCLSLVGEEQRLRASLWIGQWQRPAAATSPHVRRGEPCGSPHVQIRLPEWWPICPRACPYGPSSQFVVLA